MPRLAAAALLLCIALLWGMAFVAQKTAMSDLGPLLFSAVRYGLALVVLIPLVVWEWQRRERRVIARRHWGAALLLSVAFFFGVWLQQAGLTMTTVTNGGFLTGLYVLFVPLLGVAVFRTLPHPIAWLCMPMALVGIFFLNGATLSQFNAGDGLVILSAVCWAVQVLLIGYVARWTGLPVLVTALCFGVTALLATIGGLITEPLPALSAFGNVWFEIVYSGVFSSAIAFTLQAWAQRFVPPANAAIILSAESLFAALGGALILGERLSPIGYFGAFMLFTAIVLVELGPALRRRPEPVLSSSSS